MQKTFSVSGMSCEHCERSISDEISEIPGVQKVKADHVSGIVVVTSETELDDSAVSHAVEEAGYALVSA